MTGPLKDNIAILSCRPVTLDMRDPLDAAMVELPVYSDSVEATCESCGRAVWLSPRLRTVHESPMMESSLLCMRCAAIVAIVCLNNPEGRRA